MICRNHVDVEEGVAACARCGASFCGDCVVMIHGRPYCATCKNEKLLDVQSGTDRSQLSLATFGRRFAALWIDRMIFGFAAVAIAIVATLFMRTGGTVDDSFFVVFMVLIVAVYAGLIIYEALMLGSRGQTLGKIALKIKVVRPDGAPISRGQAWGRSVLRGVMIHVLSLLNYIPAMVTKEKTCIHDLVANTRVVNVE